MNEQLECAYYLHKEGNLEEANKIYTSILQKNPNNIEVLNLQARVLYDFGNLSSAISTNKQILAIEPDNKEALFNIALCYKALGEYDMAINAYKKLIEFYPDIVEAHYNLACLYADTGRVEESIDSYNKVLKLKPDDEETNYFISLAYMKNKQYKKGLKYFENRLCRKSAMLTQEHTYPNLYKNAKIWNGEKVKDKTIYTYYEAGFGDVLMFARYLPLLQKKCKKIIFKPQTVLYELFQENFPDIHVMKFFEDEKNIHFDYHIPILSLPYALNLDENNIFVYKDKYLKANETKTELFKYRYFDNNKFKIGIKWQGNTMFDLERVIDVKEFNKLTIIPDTQFYSFQTEDGSEKTKELNINDIGKNLKNFSDTAAAIENVDLIICNDTSLAHIAGAMGKPCWVLLPHLYNWRWHQDLTKCDWYDSVKIYRQSSPQNWSSVFDVLYDELHKIVSKKNSR